MRYGSFESKFALCGCIGSIFAIAILAVICEFSHFNGRSIDENPTDFYKHRRLEELIYANENEDMPCGDIFLYVKNQTPESNENTTQSTANNTDTNNSIDNYNRRLCSYAQKCGGDYPLANSSLSFFAMVLMTQQQTNSTTTWNQ